MKFNFWHVTPCLLVNNYRRFGGTALVRSLGNFLQVDKF
jgi:hypothetical protein